MLTNDEHWTDAQHALRWRVVKVRAAEPLLVLHAQAKLEAGELTIEQLLEVFGLCRSSWFRRLKAARELAEGAPRDGRRRRADGI